MRSRSSSIPKLQVTGMVSAAYSRHSKTAFASARSKKPWPSTPSQSSRPNLEPSEIARALERVAPHRGKMYNFDFDFFRADRLVCTEVVYRAFDGPIDLQLKERAGRPTLSAEDLLDLAFDSDAFSVVALFGATPEDPRVLQGEEAKKVLASTYRETD